MTYVIIFLRSKMCKDLIKSVLRNEKSVCETKDFPHNTL